MKDNNSSEPNKKQDLKQQMEEKKEREKNMSANEIVKLRQ